MEYQEPDIEKIGGAVDLIRQLKGHIGVEPIYNVEPSYQLDE